MKNPEIKAKVLTKLRETVAARTRHSCGNRNPMKNPKIEATVAATTAARHRKAVSAGTHHFCGDRNPMKKTSDYREC